MKNKKLFAILTLVCFMFTLMPVAAFADVDNSDAYVVLTNDEGTKVNKESLTVVAGEDVEVAVLGTTTSAVDFIFVVDAAGDLYTTDEDGTLTIKDKGTYKVYAMDKTEADAINGKVVLKADRLDAYMEAKSLVEDYAELKVKDNDVEYRIVLASDEEGFSTVETAKKYEIDINANDGWDKDGEITATLQKRVNEDAAWADVKDGFELSFNKAGYVDVVLKDGAATDRSGDVDFEVIADRAGEFKVIIKYANKAKAELTVNAVAEEVANVELLEAPKAPVDVDYDVFGSDIEFKFTDASGKVFDAVDFENDVKITVTEKPADSDVDKDTFTLAKDGDDTAGIYTLAGEFDEEGEYTIKVTLKNGKSASVNVKAAEMGDIVGIKYDVYNTPRTVAYGESTGVHAVLAYDANGVTRNVAADAKFSANGTAVASLGTLEYEGETVNYAWLTAKNDDDFIGSKITVMAEYEEFVATTELTVVDKAVTISYTDAKAEVGVNAEILGVVVDSEGNRSSIALYGDSVDGSAVVLEKPENAVVVADVVGLDADGNVVLEFLASAEGTYKVQTAVTYVGNDGNSHFVSGIAEIVVGAGAGTYDDIVVMSIGANKIVVNSEVKVIDAAPVVENNRTFVPFRALAEAFGATVAYDEATQSVTAELDGTTVVMTIGSAEYTVNGEVKTADVAPFINGSRTMVPVRFVAEAFGINVTAVYGDNGATVDVLFAK